MTCKSLSQICLLDWKCLCIIWFKYWFIMVCFIVSQDSKSWISFWKSEDLNWKCYMLRHGMSCVLIHGTGCPVAYVGPLTGLIDLLLCRSCCWEFKFTFQIWAVCWLPETEKWGFLDWLWILIPLGHIRTKTTTYFETEPITLQHLKIRFVAAWKWENEDYSISMCVLIMYVTSWSEDLCFLLTYYLVCNTVSCTKCVDLQGSC